MKENNLINLIYLPAIAPDSALGIPDILIIIIAKAVG